MKISNLGIETEVSEGVGQIKFGLDEKDHGFIFEMLRSKVYSDPIAAICREISSNSRDANREVLKGHVPVEIGFYASHPLLGGSTMCVYFKDEGPGISPDRMANVFCKYAKSTKRDSDYFTGGFGLGAKTPFAYSDSFMVITVVDGIKYFYSAYIDETRVGMIAKLDEQPVDEPNGTSIVIPIKENDRHTFERNIYKYTSMWETRPTYVAFRNEFTEKPLDNAIVLMDGKSVHLIGTSSYYGYFGGLHGILVDGIPYNVDFSQSKKYSKLDIALHYAGNWRVIMTAETGSVDLSVNRETLQYTELTVKYIDSIVDMLVFEFDKYVSDYISASASYIEACYKLHCVANAKTSSSLRNGVQIDIKAIFLMKYLCACDSTYSSTVFKYDGKAVDKEELKCLKGVAMQYVSLSPNDNVVYTKAGFSLYVAYAYDMYELDVSRGKSAIAKSILDSIKPRSRFVLISVQKPDADRRRQMKSMPAAEIAAYGASVAAEYAASMPELGARGIVVTKYSAVAVKKTAANAVARQAPEPIVGIDVKTIRMRSNYSTEGTHAMLLRVMRKNGPVDDSDNPIYHKYVFSATSDIKNLSDIPPDKKAFATLMLAYYGKTVIFAPKRHAAHFAKCQTLDDAIAKIDRRVIEKIMSALNVVELSTQMSNMGILGIDFDNAAMRDRILYLTRIAGRYSAKKMVREYVSKKWLFERIVALAGTKTDAVPHHAKEVGDFVTNFRKKYPLLSSYDTFKHCSEMKPEIERYIRLINEDERVKEKESLSQTINQI